MAYVQFLVALFFVQLDSDWLKWKVLDEKPCKL